jgi:hypothetical protein
MLLKQTETSPASRFSGQGFQGPRRDTPRNATLWGCPRCLPPATPAANARAASLPGSLHRSSRTPGAALPYPAFRSDGPSASCLIRYHPNCLTRSREEWPNSACVHPLVAACPSRSRPRPGGPKVSSPRREAWVDVSYRTQPQRGDRTQSSRNLALLRGWISFALQPTTHAVGYPLPVLRTSCPARRGHMETWDGHKRSPCLSPRPSASAREFPLCALPDQEGDLFAQRRRGAERIPGV